MIPRINPDRSQEPEPAIFTVASLTYPTGSVVTIDSSNAVIQHGVVCITDDVIVAVQPSSAPRPTGFDQASKLNTGETIYPGLIERHNHLSYNAVLLWGVQEKYTNRSQF